MGDVLTETIAACLWVDDFGANVRISWDLAVEQGEERGADSATAEQVARFRKRAQRIAAAIRAGSDPEALERLSAEAAAGPWSVSGVRRSFSEKSCVFIDAPSCAGLLVLATGQGAQALEALRDAHFVVALVNAYRAGHLVPAPLAPADALEIAGAA